ncbi:hypothetical protein EVAR_98247_1 [Eumeta japonica]|uniref:Uncharacterized protein n=1 Tax=Eumeta variegata TaxID=151549 RepID=A0A4C1Y446_EUMVA|nr:hypothetical protein EVAR_98247_1 [Eumeta japonica]
MVQKRFLRKIHFRYGSVRRSYRSLLEKYNTLNLSSRRLQLDAMMYDLSHKKYDCVALIGEARAQQRETRPKQLFAINHCRTVAGTRARPGRAGRPPPAPAAGARPPKRDFNKLTFKEVSLLKGRSLNESDFLCGKKRESRKKVSAHSQRCLNDLNDYGYVSERSKDLVEWFLCADDRTFPVPWACDLHKMKDFSIMER